MKGFFYLISIISIILVFTIFAGCTSSNSGTNNPSISPSEPIQKNTVPASDVAPQPRNLNQQKQGPVSVTIDAAKKKINSKPGSVFLVLNITVKNKNLQGGFVFTNKSIVLGNPDDRVRVDLEMNFRPEFQKDLENPIIPQTKLDLNDSISGQIIFGLPDSENYNLLIMGNDREILTSQPIHFENLTTTENPVSFTIKSAKKFRNFTTSQPAPGHIILVLDVSIKNNDLPEGFVYTDPSTNLVDLVSGGICPHSVNGGVNIRQNVENPIIPPTMIEKGETVNGQLIYLIEDSSDYRLNLAGDDQTLLLYKNIHFE
ncbi:MAG: hypothetical protein WCP36_01310 [Methanomicrobiales archaeon]